MARALCQDKKCAQAVPLLQQATEQAKVAFGENSVPVGLGFYWMGVTYWHMNERVEAGVWMERGIKRLKEDLGWGHPMYIDALREYSRFLREFGSVEEAAALEREVHQADAVVDVSTLTRRAKTAPAADLR